MITIPNRLTLTEGRGIYDKDQITEEPCDGKLSRTDLKGRREVVISPADPNCVMLDWLLKLAAVETRFGYETANLRNQLGLIKSKDKSAQTPESHAVDGLALACSEFVQYEVFHTANTRGHQWSGSVQLTPSAFRVIRRPPISRRQLHLMVPSIGGVRRKYGGTTTRHGVRKGDVVRAEMAGRVCVGWVSGDTQKQISVSDANWKRLGQFTASKVQLLARANGLVVSRQPITCFGGIEPHVSSRSYSSPRTRRRGFPEVLMKTPLPNS